MIVQKDLLESTGSLNHTHTVCSEHLTTASRHRAWVGWATQVNGRSVATPGLPSAGLIRRTRPWVFARKQVAHFPPESTYVSGEEIGTSALLIGCQLLSMYAVRAIVEGAPVGVLFTVGNPDYLSPLRTDC